MKKTDFYELERKYRDAPRKGWTVKGSRARANQTIEVNRQEVCRALSEAGIKASVSSMFCKQAGLYERMLCELADGEPDAVECGKCSGIYQIGWLDGKCPYCEIARQIEEEAAE